MDATGNVYVADTRNNSIRRITPAGVTTTVAGLGFYNSYANVDGAGTEARFERAYAIAVGPAGEFYVADTDSRTVRKITPAGGVTTLAGAAGVVGSSDGTGPAARFYQLQGVAVDAAGNVYVSDVAENTVRKITPGGVVTTMAGLAGVSGHVDGSGAAARFLSPQGLAVDRAGNVFVADTGNGTIREITPAGTVSTLAGSVDTTSDVDGTGAAAGFDVPAGLAIDSSSNLYVTEPSIGTVRKVTSAGVVTTIAGTHVFSGASIDGPVATARFDYPTGIAVDAAGNLFIAEAGPGLIRMISPAGVVSTLAGAPNANVNVDGTGSTAAFEAADGIAVDTAGNLYVTSTTTVRAGLLPASPKIITQPQSLSVAEGGTVQFVVVAAAAPAPTYQWYVGATAYLGATSSTLSFTNAHASDAGDYTVMVSNSLGTVTSAKATLTIAAATPTTPTTPTGGTGMPGRTASNGGGGSTAPWFAVALLALVGWGRRFRRHS